MNPVLSRFIDRYGTYVAIAALAVLVLAVAPSQRQAPADEFAVGGGAVLGGGAGGVGVDGAGGDGGDTDQGGAGGGGAAGGGAGTGTGGGDAGSAGPRPGGLGPGASAVQGRILGEDCSRREILGPDMPCRPIWEGDNGGATFRGVSGEQINVLFYSEASIEFVDTALRGAGLSDSEQEAREAQELLRRWFNENFETYGRHVTLEFVQGRAEYTDAAAQRADAVRYAQEHEAFAIAATVANNRDFMDELARQQVICLGCGIQQLGTFYSERAPFIYSLLGDAETTNAGIAEYIVKKLGRESTADFAGLGIRGQPRRYGIFFPQEVYAGNAQDLRERMEAAGIPVTRMVGYVSDINTAAQQAVNAIQQMRAAGVTSLLCVCDPVAPLFLTEAAQSQQYHPEWIQTGYFGQDLDAVARFYNQEQWSRSFGPAVIPPSDDPENSSPYRLWRQEKGEGRVPLTMSAAWAPILTVFTALELAGPALDPGTFRDAMFSIRIEHTSKFVPQVSWGPDDFGGIDDAYEVWWSPNATGPDGQRGTYMTVNNGRRYVPGGWPATPTMVFRPECTAAGSCGAEPGPGN